MKDKAQRISHFRREVAKILLKHSILGSPEMKEADQEFTPLLLSQVDLMVQTADKNSVDKLINDSFHKKLNVTMMMQTQPIISKLVFS